MRKVLFGSAALICLFGAFWTWTLWSVYFAGGPTIIEPPHADTEITVTTLSDGFHVLQGAGSNITVLDGPDGLLVIDTGFLKMAPAILAAIRSFSEAPVITVVNTHNHGDHAEANPAIASDTAQVAMHSWSIEDLRIAGKTELLGKRPNIVVEDRHEFRFNGQTVRLIHAPLAHTAGDLVAVFEPANIVVTGDTLFTDKLPYLSVRTGATLDGHLAAQTMIIALSDADTVIVPGHGEITDRQGAREVNGDLQRIRDRLAWAKGIGLPREAALLLHPIRGWPASRQLDGDWEKFWVSFVWGTLP